MKALAVGVLTLGLVATGGYAVSRAIDGRDASDTVRVVRVIDGDTIDVDSKGKTQRIRLLNIDTPETKHPTKAVQCLGPEATDFLKGILSPGDTVHLDYDADRVDGYGRTLAAVSKDGVDISTSIADAGYGVAIKIGANDRFYLRVKEGEDRARKAGRGLFAPDADCTLPAQLAALEAQVVTLPTTPAAEADLEVPLALAAAIAADAEALSTTLTTIRQGGEITRVWRLAYQLPDLEKRLAAVSRAAGSSRQQLSQESAKRMRAADDARKKKEADEAARKKQEAEKKAAEKKAAEKRAAEKKAADEAARTRRAEQQAADKAAREAQARRLEARRRESAPRATTPPRRPSGPTRPAPARPAPKKSVSSTSPQRQTAPRRAKEQAPKTKYTGPRCYAPGGKTWKPCPSKGG